MQHKKYLLLAFLTITSLLNAKENDLNSTQNNNWIFLPYAFSSDSTGFAGGISAMKTGLFQPQTTFIATAFTGLPQDVIINEQEDEATFSGGFISFTDYKLPYTDRLFLSFMGLKSYFPKNHYYIDGSHTSDENDVYISSGDSDFFTATLRYTLPIGEGIDNPSGIYELENGFCVGRDDCGNGTPFITGRTSIGLKAFYQTDNTENTEMWQDSIWWQNGTSKPTWNTNGLRLFLTHDNTDFDINPLIDEANSSPSPEGMLEFTKENAVTHIFVNNYEFERLSVQERFTARGFANWLTFRDYFTDQVYKDKYCELYEINN